MFVVTRRTSFATIHRLMADFFELLEIIDDFIRADRRPDKVPFDAKDRERALRAVLFVLTADRLLSKEEAEHLTRQKTWLPDGSKTEVKQLIEDVLADLTPLRKEARLQYAEKLAAEFPDDDAVRHETLVACAIAAAVDRRGIDKHRAAYTQLAALLGADADAIDRDARGRIDGTDR